MTIDEAKRLYRELEIIPAPADKDVVRATMCAIQRAVAEKSNVLLLNGQEYELRPWVGQRTDVYGNNRACNCPDLMQVVGCFCVCRGRCWCPKHGGPRCVGGHD